MVATAGYTLDYANGRYLAIPLPLGVPTYAPQLADSARVEVPSSEPQLTIASIWASDVDHVGGPCRQLWRAGGPQVNNVSYDPDRSIVGRICPSHLLLLI